MTHEEAFLQAILDRPEEDLSRLVHADWLLDQGDPKGEFIQVQCRLASMAADDEQRPSLEERERQLLQRHQDEWLGSLLPLLSGWHYSQSDFLTVDVVFSRPLEEDTARPQ
jgi:uncharacterized protein (TIGR02996 family)